MLTTLLLVLLLGCSSGDASEESTRNPQEQVPGLDEPEEIALRYTHLLEPLSDGGFVLTVGGDLVGGDGWLLFLEPDMMTVSGRVGPLAWPHTARQMEDGSLLVTETGAGRILKMNLDGEVLLEVSGFEYPNEAQPLEGGRVLVTDRDAGTVTEYDDRWSPVWEVSGLRDPHNGKRLPDGTTLVCDLGRDMVVEYGRSGRLVRSYDVPDGPKNADRLSDGSTLVSSSRAGVVVLLNSSGTELWRVANLSTVYDADMLPDGTVVASAMGGIFTVADGQSVQRQIME